MPKTNRFTIAIVTTNYNTKDSRGISFVNTKCVFVEKFRFFNAQPQKCPEIRSCRRPADEVKTLLPRSVSRGLA